MNGGLFGANHWYIGCRGEGGGDGKKARNLVSRFLSFCDCISKMGFCMKREGGGVRKKVFFIYDKVGLGVNKSLFFPTNTSKFVSLSMKEPYALGA